MAVDFEAVFQRARLSFSESVAKGEAEEAKYGSDVYQKARDMFARQHRDPDWTISLRELRLADQALQSKK